MFRAAHGKLEKTAAAAAAACDPLRNVPVALRLVPAMAQIAAAALRGGESLDELLTLGCPARNAFVATVLAKTRGTEAGAPTQVITHGPAAMATVMTPCRPLEVGGDRIRTHTHTQTKHQVIQNTGPGEDAWEQKARLVHAKAHADDLRLITGVSW